MVNYLPYLIKYRTIAELLSRIKCLWKRYGLSTAKMQYNLSTYQELLKKYDVIPTFFIPGKVLERHAKIIRNLIHNKTKLGIHGYRHIDFRKLNYKKQKKHIERAVGAFKKLAFQCSGFRSPYLGMNSGTLTVLEDTNLLWDSSQPILWEVIKEKNLVESKQSYKSINLYNCQDASTHLAIPNLRYNIVEIPVSLPDDDILIDQMGLGGAIKDAWTQIFHESYRQGELFTLQLHPERIELCKDALESILRTANHYKPRVWISPLSEVARWWRDRSKFYFKLYKKGNNVYHIKAFCSDNSTILIKNVGNKSLQHNFFNGYKIVPNKNLIVETKKRPAIGVSSLNTYHLIEFLKNEGFLFEISEDKNSYRIYFDNNMDVENNPKKVLHLINRSPFPVIRFWRWPNDHRSALSVTGDIDSFTLMDFFYRAIGY